MLIPRVTHWPKHGRRAEVVIDDGGLGDIKIGPFVPTREEAHECVMAPINNCPTRNP
jgi:hypothetical protein